MPPLNIILSDKVLGELVEFFDNSSSSWSGQRLGAYWPAKFRSMGDINKDLPPVGRPAIWGINFLIYKRRVLCGELPYKKPLELIGELKAKDKPAARKDLEHTKWWMQASGVKKTIDFVRKQNHVSATDYSDLAPKTQPNGAITMDK